MASNWGRWIQEWSADWAPWGTAGDDEGGKGGKGGTWGGSWDVQPGSRVLWDTGASSSSAEPNWAGELGRTSTALAESAFITGFDKGFGKGFIKGYGKCSSDTALQT